MRKLGASVLVIAFVVALLLSLSSVSLATPLAQEEGGLLVSGAMIDLVVEPGKTYTHRMNVGNGASAPARDVIVEARGFGQSPQGSFLAVEVEEDKSPYSARKYIQRIDNASFHLDPGASRAVNVTIAVPTDVGLNTRYATVLIFSRPSNSATGSNVATIVPVILTPKGATMTETARITDLTINEVVSGQPIKIVTTVQNTGNHHFKAANEVTIKDAAGRVVGLAKLPLSGTSIIPTMSREFVISESLFEGGQGLRPGTYTVESRVTHANGALLDSRRAAFEVAAPYQPFPGIDESSLVVTRYNNEEPFPIDARDKADVELSFSGTGRVSGTVVVGRFKQEPSLRTAFSAPVEQGGMGQTAVKYVGVGVQGFDQGVGHVAVYYREGELNGMNANSLFLAYWDGEGWQKLEKIGVFTGAGKVTGDISVDALTRAPIIALGGKDVAPAAGFQSNWYTLSGALGAVVVLGAIGGLVVSLRRRSAGIKAAFGKPRVDRAVAEPAAGAPVMKNGTSQSLSGQKPADARPSGTRSTAVRRPAARPRTEEPRVR
ncbi:MAG: hypothetical protein ACUVX1_07495 [Chloroflexota bacterium]